MSIKLAFEVVGNGPPVVILHGLFGAGRNWAPIAQALGHSYRFYLPDARNHGASPWAEAMSYPDMALDATQRLLARRSIPARAGVEASYCGLPTRLDRLEFEQRGGRMSIWADLRLTLSKTAKPAAVPAADDAPRTSAYRFPEVMPLRIKASGGAGKVIPMRRNLPAHGS